MQLGRTHRQAENKMIPTFNFKVGIIMTRNSHFHILHYQTIQTLVICNDKSTSFFIENDHVSDLVGNPEDRFSHVAAQLIKR